MPLWTGLFARKPKQVATSLWLIPLFPEWIFSTQCSPDLSEPLRRPDQRQGVRRTHIIDCIDRARRPHNRAAYFFEKNGRWGLDRFPELVYGIYVMSNLPRAHKPEHTDDPVAMSLTRGAYGHDNRAGSASIIHRITPQMPLGGDLTSSWYPASRERQMCVWGNLTACSVLGVLPHRCAVRANSTRKPV